MTKEELKKVALDKIDEKHYEIELNFEGFKETGDPNYLRICSEARGFNYGISWLLEKAQEVEGI